MLRVAISPCPNDTVIFYPWVKGLVGKELPMAPLLADIQMLNELALKGIMHLTKVSFPCFGKIASQYQLLPLGSALGLNCGPKIISKNPYTLEELANKKIALPGSFTTAHLLFDIFGGHLNAKKFFCRYDEIFSLLKQGAVEAGVIIHESRFTFAEAGFFEVADLGSLWHTKTSALLPLGGLAVLRSNGQKVNQEIVNILEACFSFFLEKKDAAMDYVLLHAQEKKQEIVDQHINLYVNEETKHLSKDGIASIQTLMNYATQLEYFPSLPQDFIYGI